ncbi:hypothetical protein BV898_03603 [Hypsibius exemplaris]|uniref:Uncharacterized protein n=1 Tax=Hypsibius exemplaris TaxID=2072580 RepID=A0A1W0X4Z0_HYPEX|nr:hypothetical protein BV898_03603 [Hypsibius exemplaris]
MTRRGVTMTGKKALLCGPDVDESADATVRVVEKSAWAPSSPRRIGSWTESSEVAVEKYLAGLPLHQGGVGLGLGPPRSPWKDIWQGFPFTKEEWVLNWVLRGRREEITI